MRRKGEVREERSEVEEREEEEEEEWKASCAAERTFHWLAGSTKCSGTTEKLGPISFWLSMFWSQHTWCAWRLSSTGVFSVPFFL